MSLPIFQHFSDTVTRQAAEAMGLPAWMLDELYPAPKKITGSLRHCYTRPDWLIQLTIRLENLPRVTIILSEQQHQSLMEWRTYGR